MSDRNARIIEEFRTNEGRVGGFFEGRTLLLLTHRGARTGTERTNPLAYRREGDRVFVFGSKGGSPADPDWARNLRANPDVEVEIGTDRYPATAVEVTGAERDAVYARQAADWPQFGAVPAKVDAPDPGLRAGPGGLTVRLTPRRRRRPRAAATPVMKLASSLARNTTARATSSGWPIRGIGRPSFAHAT